jgi:glycine oxidase
VRVAIIGAGVMGCACAEALAARGVAVTLLERAIPGAEASSAAAGILGAQVESHADPASRGILVEARGLFAGWAQSLRESTGIDIGYRKSGVVRVVLDEASTLGLKEEVRVHRAAGLAATLLSAADVGRIEPEVTPEAFGGVHFPDDAQVDPRALLRALVVAISRAGVTQRSGTIVRSLLIERDTCRGVVLDQERVEADAVVLAAGSWSSLIGGLPASLPVVTPARGQMVLLEERPPRMRSIVFGPDGYVVPRGDGRVLCGSTLEHVGFRREVTAGGVSAILDGTLRLVPRLAAAELSATWASFRPQSASDRPLLGASLVPGLFLATGHHRNGILLAKYSANLVAEAICAGPVTTRIGP